MLDRIKKSLSGNKKQTDWKAVVLTANPEAKFFPPASVTQIQEAEKTLNRKLPNQLSSFLQTSNGLAFSEKDGYHFIKNIDELVKENRKYWSHERYQDQYMPLEPLLFFGSPGVDGIEFGYSYSKAGNVNPGIFFWNPIEDSRTWVAENLSMFITWWFEGKIKV